MSTHELIDNAIQAADELRERLLSLTANDANRDALDAAYLNLHRTIESLHTLANLNVCQ